MSVFQRLDDSSWNRILDKITMTHGTSATQPFAVGTDFSALNGVNYSVESNSNFHQAAVFDFAAGPTMGSTQQVEDGEMKLSLAEFRQMKEATEIHKKRLDTKCLQVDKLLQDMQSVSDYLHRLQPFLEEMTKAKDEEMSTDPNHVEDGGAEHTDPTQSELDHEYD